MEHILDRFKTKIDCDDTGCSLRYVLDGETYGVLRYSYYKGVGIYNQDVVLLRTMEINKMLQDLEKNSSFIPNYVLETDVSKYVKILRDRGTKIVTDYVKGLPKKDTVEEEKDID